MHCTLSLSPGGRREAILNLLRSKCMQDGFVSHLLELSGSQNMPSEDTLAQSMTTISRQGACDAATVNKVRQLVEELQVDLVHVHDAASNIVLAAALRGSNIPLLSTFHRSNTTDTKPLGVRLRSLLAHRRTSAIVAPSQERVEHYAAHHHGTRQKLRVINHGIDTKKFIPDPTAKIELKKELGLAADSMVVGAVGHFGPDKGIDIVIQAFDQLSQQVQSPLYLVILGKGQQRGETFIKKQIERCAAKERIVCAGFQREPRRYFSLFDLFLHGARSEAFGLVMAEAMSCGCPVIATRTGGAVEIIEAGATGELVPLEDPLAMANAAQPLLSDLDLRERYSAASVSRAREQFSLEREASAYISLYNEFLTQSTL